MPILRGGCFCGAVRYQVDGTPYDRTLCHCSICRRTTGAPLVAWFSVPRSGFRLVQGSPVPFRSSAGATRSFCGTCGSQLIFAADAAPDELDVALCTLDDPDALPPEDHTFHADRMRWLHVNDALPRHAGARPK